MYIFIDESGDLGSGKGSSRYFILAAIIVSSAKPLEKVVKSVRKSLKKKHGNITEFHAYNERQRFKRKFLTRISSVPGLNVAFITYPKKVTLSAVQQKEVYAKMAQELVLMIFKSSQNTLDGTTIIFDKRYGRKFPIEKSIRLILEKVQAWRRMSLSVSVVSSEDSKGLQATDFVAWSFSHYLESEDCEYFDLIKSCVVAEKTL